MYRRLGPSFGIGLALAIGLNLVVMFVPLPDAVAEAIVFLEAPGLFLEMARATPYHASIVNVLAINTLVYSAAAYALLAMRARRSGLARRTA